MYYGTQILENSGFGTKTALIANVANGLIAVIAVIVGMSLTNKINRRTMLLTGLTGSVGTMIIYIRPFPINHITYFEKRMIM
jgi:major inositol transporter-like SP family MFS transporter